MCKVVAPMTDMALDVSKERRPLMIELPTNTPRADETGVATTGGLIDLRTIDLGIICPMASEADSAIRFVDAVLAQCRARDFKSVTFFAVLDNACKDNTRELLNEHAKRNPELRVVWAPENRG